MNKIFVYLLLIPFLGVSQTINVRYSICTGCCDATQCTDVGDISQFTYGNVSNYTSQNVKSDFAPRPRNSYDWHGGIDFSAQTQDEDKGDLIFPVEGGIVTRLKGIAGFKYIALHEGLHYWGYGHLFNSAAIPSGSYVRSGNVVMKARSDNATQYAIIFINESPIRAIGIGGEVEWEGITYPVTNTVPYNVAVAPIGDSADGYDPDAHLHLFLFADASLNSDDGKTKNPLDILTYPKPMYSAETTITNGYDTNPASVKVKLSMDGESGAGEYSVVQNANVVGFRMRHLGEAVHPELIKGKIWGYISLGGKLSGTPGNAPYPDYIVKSGIANRGSETRTGISPFAYRNNAWDEYYFSDFYTRIHEASVPGSTALNLAGIPKSARYPEGRYEVMPSLHTIQGDNSYKLFDSGNSVREVDIDNFWPYVEGVDVFFGGKPVYNANYYKVKPCNPPSNCNNTTVLFQDLTNDGLRPNMGGLSSSQMEMYALLSEPLSGQLSGQLWDPDGVVHSISTVESLDGGTGKLWKVKYNSIPLICDGEYKFKFYGTDIAGHQLLNFDIWGNSNAEEIIPFRTGANTWSPSNPQSAEGESKLYKFTNKCSCSLPGAHLVGDHDDRRPTNTLLGDCECEPIADFSYESASGGITINFDATQSTGEQPVTYAWDFGDGSSGSGIKPSCTYSESGQYVIRLTVTDKCGNTATQEQAITVTDGNGPSLQVEIDAPGEALVDQTVTFTAVVSGGVPPYKYCWDANLTGDPQFVPGKKCEMLANVQDIVFHQYTAPVEASVYVTITDAVGTQKQGYHSINIKDAVLKLEIAHFPASPPGSCSGPQSEHFGVNQYIYWVANVTPLLETPTPAEYTWNFGDGTTVTEPYGQTAHSFATAGTYMVTLEMCDLLGNCTKTSKAYCVGEVPPVQGGYKITPETTVQMTWGGASQAIALVSSGSFCAPVDNCGPRIPWTLRWADCLYEAEFNTSAGGAVGSSFLINVNGTDPCPSWEFSDPTNTPVHPWGCLYVEGRDPNGTSNLYCGSADKNCVVYMNPSELRIQNVRVEEAAICTFKVKVDLIGGGWRFPFMTQNTGLEKTYKEYQWKAYDMDDPTQEIIGILTNTDTRSPGINTSHPYLDRFTNGRYVQFITRLKVTDWANQVGEGGGVISFNPFKLNVKEQYGRCPETWSHFEEDRMATGGTGNYEFIWSVTQPAGGSLDFESGDAHDPNPYFKAPATGSKQYLLVVKMKDASGNVVCERQKQITVTASNLNLTMLTQSYACSGQGTASLATIGPYDLTALGGSGRYGFEWQTADPADLVYVSDIFTPNPVVQGIPAGQTITYTLVVGDLTSDCTATASVQVTGFDNDLSVTLAATPSDIICYGAGAELKAQGSPVGSGWGAFFYQYHWETDNRHHDLSGLNSYTKTLPIGELESSYPGLYKYKVRYTNIVSGCYAEKEVEVRVLPQWTHIGYVPSVKSAVAGTSVDLWSGNSNSISGITPNIDVNWIPFNPVSIDYFSGAYWKLPKNGKFISTTSTPFLTMKVTDQVTGCWKNFKSIRYILSDEQPELWITGENPVICDGTSTKLNIFFDAHLSNYATSLLPSSLQVDVKIYSPWGPPFPPAVEQGVAVLSLVNSAGLYKGQYDTKGLNRPTNSNYYCKATLTSDIWTGTPSAFYELIISSGGHSSSTSTCTSDGGNFATKIDYGIGCTSGVHQIMAPKKFFARDYIEIHTPASGASIELTTNDPQGFKTGPNLLIDPCILGQSPPPAQGDSISELVSSDDRRIIAADTGKLVTKRDLVLEIFPNPFTGEVSIRYTVPPDCPGDVTLYLRDFTGRQIRTIVHRANAAPGEYQAVFDGSQLASGIYLYELVVCNGAQIVKKAEKISH